MPDRFPARARLEHGDGVIPFGDQDIPHAAGAACRNELKGENAVTLCYFGDGVTSKGDFHVGLNIAALKKSALYLLLAITNMPSPREPIINMSLKPFHTRVCT